MCVYVFVCMYLCLFVSECLCLHMSVLVAVLLFVC